MNEQRSTRLSVVGNRPVTVRAPRAPREPADSKLLLAVFVVMAVAFPVGIISVALVALIEAALR